MGPGPEGGPMDGGLDALAGSIGGPEGGPMGPGPEGAPMDGGGAAASLGEALDATAIQGGAAPTDVPATDTAAAETAVDPALDEAGAPQEEPGDSGSDVA